jgi:hypothetical protein
MSSLLIKDNEIRKAVDDLDKRISRLENIPQIPKTSSLEYVIDVLNRMTNNVKRKI